MTTQTHAFAHTEPLPGLLWGYHFDGKGATTELTSSDTIANGPEGWTWLHFNLADVRCKPYLASLPGLSEAVKLLSATDIEPQAQFNEFVGFGAVADLGRDVGETRDRVGFLHFIRTDNLLITARRGALYAPGALRKTLQDGAKPASVEDLFEMLLDQALTGADNLCETISKSVDKIEDRVARGMTGGARPSLGMHRLSAIALHRHVSGQKTFYQRLSRENGAARIPASLIATAARLRQDCETLDREILTLLERIKSLQDEVSASLAEETNSNLRIMSILTILFIPPTFVTSLFGMNLKGMLFGEYEPGFWYGTATAIGSSVLVAWILRRAGILGKGPE